MNVYPNGVYIRYLGRSAGARPFTGAVRQRMYFFDNSRNARQLVHPHDAPLLLSRMLPGGQFEFQLEAPDGELATPASVLAVVGVLNMSKVATSDDFNLQEIIAQVNGVRGNDEQAGEQVDESEDAGSDEESDQTDEDAPASTDEAEGDKEPLPAKEVAPDANLVGASVEKAYSKQEIADYNGSDAVTASQTAIDLATGRGVHMSLIEGTGKDGLITVRNVQDYIKDNL